MAFTDKITSESLLYYSLVLAFFSMPFGTSPPLIFGALAFSFWIASKRVFRIKEFYQARWFLPVILMIVLPWLGMLYTPDPNGLGISFAEKTHNWIYCMAVASLSFRIYPPEKLIKAFLWGLALNALVGLLQLIGILEPTSLGYSGLGRGYSTLSAYLILGMLVSSYYYKISEDKRTRMLMLALTAFYFFHLIILRGRTGYVAFVILYPVIMYNFFRKINLLNIALAGILLIGAMLCSPIVRDRINLSVEQLEYHIHADKSKAWGRQYTDEQDRFYMWYGAVHIFKNHPLFGVGTGGYTTVLKEMGKPQDPEITHPHNDLLYMAVSYGLVGIIVFFWFFGEMIRSSWKQRHTVTGWFVFSTALVTLSTGLFNGQTVDAGMIFLLAVSVGLQQSFPEFLDNKLNIKDKCMEKTLISPKISKAQTKDNTSIFHKYSERLFQ